MGYTHYWYRDTQGTEPPEAFGRLLMDVKKIIEAAQDEGIVIRNWDGTGEPTLTEGEFRLNGDGAFGLDHETFAWTAEVPEQVEWRQGERMFFDFCKTARKPYDVVVGAALIRAKLHYGDTIHVSSDGDWDDHSDAWETWADVRAFYFRTFGEEPECPFSESLEGVA